MDAGGRGLAAIGADDAIGQRPEMPGHPLRQQMPGAVVQAVAGVRLTGHQDLHAFARSEGPPRLVAQKTADIAGGKRVLPRRGFVEPAFGAAVDAAAVEKQHRHGERCRQRVGRGRGNLGCVKPHIDAATGVVAQDDRVGVAARQGRGQHGLLRAGKQHQAVAAGGVVRGQHHGGPNRQQRAGSG